MPQFVQPVKWISWIAILALILSVSCTKSPTIPSPPPDAPKQTAFSLGVREPETLSVQEVALEDDELVIGVSAGDKHRAYLVKAMTTPPELVSMPTSELGHRIVNDLLGGVPITVTYCEETKSCRVLTSSGTKSLDLAVSGLLDEGMVVLLNGRQYPQMDPQLPLKDYMFQLTTWKKWKSEHPQTDIYIGTLDKG